MRRNERRSGRILLPTILTFGALLLIALAILLVAARETDEIALERQSHIIASHVDEFFDRISHDQESTTIWDESVVNTHAAVPDYAWFDNNLGVWLHDYFGHDRVYMLTDTGRPIYAMIAGARADPASYERVKPALGPVVDKLRADLRAGAADEEGRQHASDLVEIDGRPALASAVPIVSDSGDIEQTPGSEFVHISLVFLDGELFQRLLGDDLVEAAHFVWPKGRDEGDPAVTIAEASGAPFGYLVWEPRRPGWRMLVRSAPVLALAFLLMSVLVTLLARRLNRALHELQASEAHAQHLAFHDPLTGLGNRALFNDRFDRALAEMRRSGSRMALLYLDLDRFKNVNDTLGHPAGDDLIRELATRLSGLVRGADCVARLGGDEFTVLQTDIASEKDVAALCERIIQCVGRPFKILEKSAFVGVSIGVAIAPDAGVDRAELMRKADIALYRAKTAGRNQFRVFADEMDVFVKRRREIEQELRSALAAGDQFCLHYQPLYSSSDEKLVGVEALLRWHHPRLGMVSPGVFIPIAEESGLIQPIGEWVLEEACAAASRWPISHIAVNVSPAQFRSPGFADKVCAILKKHGLPPPRLELEVTESVLLDSAELSSATFKRLREAGVRIALDDFGTGYSSLNYLAKFPVDKIKIDRSFVQNLDSSEASDAIVQAMVDLARAIGVNVTAEGVETTRQRDFLQSIGCNELQGFLLSRPLQADEIDRMLGVPAAPAVATAA
jgi:diguanylate cyclase (GGDEF)-like protein